MAKIPGRAETDSEKTLVTQQICDKWTMLPQLRLGQLIVNAIGERDLFNIEDDELVRMVEEFAKEHG